MLLQGIKAILSTVDNSPGTEEIASSKCFWWHSNSLLDTNLLVSHASSCSPFHEDLSKNCAVVVSSDCVQKPWHVFTVRRMDGKREKEKKLVARCCGFSWGGAGQILKGQTLAKVENCTLQPAPCNLNNDHNYNNNYNNNKRTWMLQLSPQNLCKARKVVLCHLKRDSSLQKLSPALGGENSALLALPNAMTNDASFAAPHSAPSLPSLLLHSQRVVTQA